MRGEKNPIVEVILGVSIVTLLIVLLLGAGSFSWGSSKVKSGPARIESEIAALGAAIESYKSDFGDYPKDAATERLSPFHPYPSDYIQASHTLYRILSGSGGGKVYFEFFPRMLATNSAGDVYLVDACGQSYGYSYNGKGWPHIWSTAGDTTGSATNRWIRN